MLSQNVKVFSFQLVEIFKWMRADFSKIKPGLYAEARSVLIRRYILCTVVKGIFG
jgi:hypothetical protein